MVLELSPHDSAWNFCEVKSNKFQNFARQNMVAKDTSSS